MSIDNIKLWQKYEESLLAQCNYTFNRQAEADYFIRILLLPKFAEPCVIIIEQISETANLLIYLINSSKNISTKINYQNLISLKDDQLSVLDKLIDYAYIKQMNDQIITDDRLITRLEFNNGEHNLIRHVNSPNLVQHQSYYLLIAKLIKICISTMKDKQVFLYFRTIRYYFTPAINLRSTEIIDQ